MPHALAHSRRQKVDKGGGSVVEVLDRAEQPQSLVFSSTPHGFHHRRMFLAVNEPVPLHAYPPDASLVLVQPSGRLVRVGEEPQAGKCREC